MCSFFDSASNSKLQTFPTWETAAAGTGTPSTLNTTVATPDRLSVTSADTLAQPTTVVIVTTSGLSTPLTVLVLTIGSRMAISGGVVSTSQANDASEVSMTRSRSRAWASKV